MLDENDNRAVPIAKGAIFIVSTGSYSDYSIRGVFRALAEIDGDALAREHEYNEDKVMAALILDGRAEEIEDSRELWVERPWND